DPNVYYQANYAPFNILHELDANNIDLNLVDTKFQAELAYNPIRDLRLDLVGAVQYDASTQENNVEETSNEAEAYRAMGTSQIRDHNNYLYTDPNDAYALPISILPTGGFYQRTDLKKLSWDAKATANYNHVFNNIHTLNVLGGLDVSNVDREHTWFNGVGMQYERGMTPFYIYQYFKKAQEQNNDYYSLSETHNRTAAFFGTATYSYKQRYNLTGTIRYEGTNRLGHANSARWLPTWNISGSWNAYEEPWFQKVFQQVMTHATIRAS
ncbi:MAG TPA: SusC/RagA family protein, partial [Prevotella sp.]|nr:SusC/RagA family protein [Prevotella sp.]